MKIYLSLIVLVTLLLPFILSADTIIVPDDYPTIQEAIDASRHGDTVIVEPGRYVEGINFRGKGITVASRFYTEQDTSYISSTIIDGNKEVPSVVVFESEETSSSRLIGFTITGGYAESDDPLQTSGGGIRLFRFTNTPPPVISDCVVRDNYASHQGGGIYVTGGITLRNTKAYSNNSIGAGGGIFLDSAYSRSEIINCQIYDNHTDFNGGGLSISGPLYGKIRVDESSIHNNEAKEGGGIWIVMTDTRITIENTEIFNNRANKGGGVRLFYKMFAGTSFEESITKFVNCTIVNNKAQESGGGMYLSDEATCLTVNSIVFDNYPEEIAFSPDEEPNNFAIAYTNIKGRERGIETNDNGELHWLEGNIDRDPLFVDAENDNFRLKEDSPCIDAGIDSFFYDDNLIFMMPDDKYYGDAPDMGAFQWSGVSTGHNELPLPQGNKMELYPNPFNPSVTVKLSIAQAGDTSLGVFNIRGEKVLTLSDTFLDKGNHYYTWYGKDNDGNSVSSGVYLVKLEQNDEITLSKATLMK